MTGASVRVMFWTSTSGVIPRTLPLTRARAKHFLGDWTLTRVTFLCTSRPLHVHTSPFCTQHEAQLGAHCLYNSL